ncbi:MAG: 7-carboxy-7-deazaguanine synthase [Bacteroidota bacterium]
MYKIKEIYYTLQGEGAQSGRPAVFCRFTGCNLWSGREEDRHKAICQFCDTDFWGTDGENGGRYTAEALAQKINELWPHQPTRNTKYVVCTGGEPLLQLDQPLIKALKERGFEIAVETNGTIVIPEGIDWVCMSPKANTELKVFSGDELKLVYPQKEAMPEQYDQLDYKYFFIQPMDGPEQAKNIQLSMRYCLEHPQWRLSLQTHKILEIP